MVTIQRSFSAVTKAVITVDDRWLAVILSAAYMSWGSGYELYEIPSHNVHAIVLMMQLG